MKISNRLLSTIKSIKNELKPVLDLNPDFMFPMIELDFDFSKDESEEGRSFANCDNFGLVMNGVFFRINMPQISLMAIKVYYHEMNGPGMNSGELFRNPKEIAAYIKKIATEKADKGSSTNSWMTHSLGNKWEMYTLDPKSGDIKFVASDYENLKYQGKDNLIIVDSRSVTESRLTSQFAKIKSQCKTVEQRKAFNQLIKSFNK